MIRCALRTPRRSDSRSAKRPGRASCVAMMLVGGISVLSAWSCARANDALDPILPRLLELKAYCDKVVPKAQRGLAYVSTATLDSVKRGGVPPDEALVAMLHTAAVSAWMAGDAETARRHAIEVPLRLADLPEGRRDGFRAQYGSLVPMQTLALLAGGTLGMDDAALLQELGTVWLELRPGGGAGADTNHFTYCTFYPESGTSPQTLMHCPLRSAVDKQGRPLRWDAGFVGDRLRDAYRRAAAQARLPAVVRPGARAAKWSEAALDGATLAREEREERILLAAWREWCEPSAEEFVAAVDGVAVARLGLAGEAARRIDDIEVTTRGERLPLVTALYVELGLEERLYGLYDPWIAAQPNPLDGIVALERSGIPVTHLRTRLERALRLLPDPDHDVPGDLCLRLAEAMAEARDWSACRDWLLRMGRSHKPPTWSDRINALCAAVAGELSPTDEGVLDHYIQMMEAVGCTLLPPDQKPSNIAQARIGYDFPMAEAERLRTVNPRRAWVLARTVRDAVREKRLKRWGGDNPFDELMFLCVESSCLFAAGETNRARATLLPALMHERYAEGYAAVCPPPMPAPPL